MTLGLAEAEHSQAMQEFPYYPQTSHSGIPSGRTEPLPGCSNWNDPGEGSIPMSGLSSHTSDQAQTGPMGAFSGNNTQVFSNLIGAENVLPANESSFLTSYREMSSEVQRQKWRAKKKFQKELRQDLNIE